MGIEQIFNRQDLPGQSVIKTLPVAILSPAYDGPHGTRQATADALKPGTSVAPA